MKKIITVLILFSTTAVSAQLENSSWHFGYHARVNFDPANPTATPTTSTSSMYNNVPGMGVGYSGSGSSVSDANGQLLFYTDGLSVWDRNDNEMPNTVNVKMYGSTDNIAGRANSVIVPKPNHPGIYYIFEYSYFIQGWPTYSHSGLHYSMVDMSLMGATPGPGQLPGPNGDVTIKNVTLLNHNGTAIDFDYGTYTGLQIYQTKIATTLHADGDKVWVTIFTFYIESGINRLYSFSYLVTENGIYDGVNYIPDGTSPKPSGSNELTDPNYIPIPSDFWNGEIKISPNGQYLCDAARSCVILYDFNRQTGNVTPNRTIFVSGPGNNPWDTYSGNGVEFSPNPTNDPSQQRIYFSTDDNILQDGPFSPVNAGKTKKYSRIFQYSIERDTTILIYEYEIPDTTGGDITTPLPTYDPYGLQLGIDNRIYVCVTPLAWTYLGVIFNPDAAGTACNFVEYSLQLQYPTYHICTLPHWVHKPTQCIKLPRVN